MIAAPAVARMLIAQRPFTSSALANVATVDLDRMVDDGGPPPHATTPSAADVRVRDIDPGRDRGSSGEWYRRLGESDRRRHESASHKARARQNRDREWEEAARLRWPGIVAAVRTNISGYNQGAGFNLLTVNDGADDKSRVLLVAGVAGTTQTLTLTIVGTELCVRPNPSAVGAADGGRRWITLRATDEAIADYALQDWLMRL